MSNNINENSKPVENIFDAFSMGSKMNTASKQERAKIVAAFMEQAKSCFVDTENTVKYLNVLMERTRLRYGFSADEFAAMLGFSSTAAYNKTFMQPNANFGTVLFPYVVQFCYLFGYNLSIPDSVSTPQTVADLYSLELASFLISLGPDAMDDISRTLVGAAYLDPTLRKLSSQILSKAKKYFYGNNGEALPNEIQYRNRLDNAESRIERLEKVEKANLDK